MPATDFQPPLLGRISIRSDQVMSMEGSHEQELEDLELFQRRVAESFSDLLPATGRPESDGEPNGNNSTASTSRQAQGTESLLSIGWLRKLVDAFLCCEAEFKASVVMNGDPSPISRPHLDRLMPDLLERSVKLLDICNGISSGLDNVRQCQTFAEIVVNALRAFPIGEGQVRRARRALSSLLTSLTSEDKDAAAGFTNRSTERAWSLGKRGSTLHRRSASGASPPVSFRSFSMTVARNWSAAKQIQAFCANLQQPRGGVESTGLACRVYIISLVMAFAMWALVAAVPCQERNGLNIPFQLSKQLTWAHGMIGLQEKISEEWKKKEKNRTAGLMEEMQKLERLGYGLVEIFGGEGSLRYPLDSDREAMVQALVTEMGDVCRRMDEGLLPLQQQIREMFHAVVRSRSEIMELMEHASGRSLQLNI